jgi:hypothetical protein
LTSYIRRGPSRKDRGSLERRQDGSSLEDRVRRTLRHLSFRTPEPHAVCSNRRRLSRVERRCGRRRTREAAGQNVRVDDECKLQIKRLNSNPPKGWIQILPRGGNTRAPVPALRAPATMQAAHRPQTRLSSPPARPPRPATRRHAPRRARPPRRRRRGVQRPPAPARMIRRGAARPRKGARGARARGPSA